jgi:hypothetical protein
MMSGSTHNDSDDGKDPPIAATGVPIAGDGAVVSAEAERAETENELLEVGYCRMNKSDFCVHASYETLRICFVLF